MLRELPPPKWDSLKQYLKVNGLQLLTNFSKNSNLNIGKDPGSPIFAIKLVKINKATDDIF